MTEIPAIIQCNGLHKKGEIYKDIKTLIDKGGIRPLHVYGHPEIFTRIRRMLYNLATHYRNSNTVIGVQLGNEEGFSFLDQSDYNPITQELFEDGRQKPTRPVTNSLRRRP